jgi:hypothetical protein
MRKFQQHGGLIVPSPLCTPCPNERRVKKRIGYLKEFVLFHVQLVANLGKNVDEMLAQDTTKNGVEVVWCHLSVNVVPDFVVVVPSPEPWLYEKQVYVLWAGGMRGCIERYAHEFSQAHNLSKNMKPYTSYLLQKRQRDRLAPRLRKRPK